MLVLRGAGALTPSVCSFIFQYTQAHLFVMLDNLNTDLVAQTWAEAKGVSATQGIEAAKMVVISRITGGSIEARTLREILTAALEHRQADRLTPHGMSRQDILDVPPVRKLVPGKKSWDELLALHEVEKGSSPKFKDFKKWLIAARDADLSDLAIREAAKGIDQWPSDFARLLKTIEAVTTS